MLCCCGWLADCPAMSILFVQIQMQISWVGRSTSGWLEVRRVSRWLLLKNQPEWDKRTKQPDENYVAWEVLGSGSVVALDGFLGGWCLKPTREWHNRAARRKLCLLLLERRKSFGPSMGSGSVVAWAQFGWANIFELSDWIVFSTFKF